MHVFEGDKQRVRNWKDFKMIVLKVSCDSYITKLRGSDICKEKKIHCSVCLFTDYVKVRIVWSQEVK